MESWLPAQFPTSLNMDLINLDYNSQKLNKKVTFTSTKLIFVIYDKSDSKEKGEGEGEK